MSRGRLIFRLAAAVFYLLGIGACTIGAAFSGPLAGIGMILIGAVFSLGAAMLDGLLELRNELRASRALTLSNPAKAPPHKPA